jgi:hypothetical protein
MRRNCREAKRKLCGYLGCVRVSRFHSPTEALLYRLKGDQLDRNDDLEILFPKVWAAVAVEEEGGSYIVVQPKEKK